MDTNFKSNNNRLDWDDFFMEQALVFSKRATCNRLKVGAIFVSQDNLQLSEGYNGSLSGSSHCIDVGCLINDQQRCIRTLHAEQNGVLNAMKKGVNVNGCKVYVTHEPCETCTKFLLQSGVSEIIYLKGYKNKYNSEFLKESNVIFREFNGLNKDFLLSLESDINKK